MTFLKFCEEVLVNYRRLKKRCRLVLTCLFWGRRLWVETEMKTKAKTRNYIVHQLDWGEGITNADVCGHRLEWHWMEGPVLDRQIKGRRTTWRQEDGLSSTGTWQVILQFKGQHSPKLATNHLRPELNVMYSQYVLTWTGTWQVNQKQKEKRYRKWWSNCFQINQNITYLHYFQGPFDKYHYEGWPPC